MSKIITPTIRVEEPQVDSASPFPGNQIQSVYLLLCTHNFKTKSTVEIRDHLDITQEDTDAVVYRNGAFDLIHGSNSTGAEIPIM